MERRVIGVRFSDAFLMELKFKNDIEDVVSRYLSLKTAGSNLVACCPFHSEKTPSFTVSKAKQFFYCFGCGAGGNVINFIMRIENADYTAAITKLAEWARIPVPEYGGGDNEKAVKQKRVFEINREAALYFHNNLINPVNSEGMAALEYVRGRNIKIPAIKHFGLGYAPNSWNGLTKYLSGLGFSKEEQKIAFLCGMTKKGDYIDYFRGRIIFPIIDLQKNVAAFGGRAINSGDTPKYLNSSDTPAFKKSRNLYAFNFAKNSLKKYNYFILCEGYMDVIAIHQAGFTNAVATLGTAVTGEQARLMSRYADRAVLAYDTDEAGKRAMQKASALLGEVGVEVRVLDFEGAKDPDEFIQKYGREKFENLLTKPKSYTENRLDAIYAKYDLEESGEKIKAINESCAELANINSEVEREVYGVRLAEKYKISPEGVSKEIKRLLTLRQRKEKSDMISRAARSLDGYGDRINPDRSKYPDAVRLEEAILGILLNYPEIYGESRYLLTDELFISEFNKKIYGMFQKAVQSDQAFDLVMITGDLSLEETDRVTKMAVSADGKAMRGANIPESLEKLINALNEKKEIMEKKNINIKDLTISDIAKQIEANKAKKEKLK